MTNSPVFILAAKRTALGSMQGAFQNTPAPQLGAQAIKAALNQSGLSGQDIDECIMGQVLTAGAGQAPARQAALYAGLPPQVGCTTINKVCGSGLKAVMLGCDSLTLGRAHAVVVGGQENMTLAPHLLEGARAGYRLGHQQVADSMIKDGLWDPYNNFHMGNAAEICVKEYKLSREEQDSFAKASYERAQKAQKEGWFKEEITPVEVKAGRDSLTVSEDEEPARARFDKMGQLRAAFEKDGSITAANASKINDGAAALVMASENLVQSRELKPLARVVSSATFSQDPKWFTTAPAGAIKKALEQAQLPIADIDLFEINEAFSMVTLVAMKELGIAHEKVNVHGGAVALGHPIGASGARILTTLIYALKRQGGRYGLATLCIGGGEAVALVVERL